MEDEVAQHVTIYAVVLGSLVSSGLQPVCIDDIFIRLADDIH